MEAAAATDATPVITTVGDIARAAVISTPAAISARVTTPTTNAIDGEDENSRDGTCSLHESELLDRATSCNESIQLNSCTESIQLHSMDINHYIFTTTSYNIIVYCIKGTLYQTSFSFHLCFLSFIPSNQFLLSFIPAWIHSRMVHTQ